MNGDWIIRKKCIKPRGLEKGKRKCGEKRYQKKIKRRGNNMDGVATFSQCIKRWKDIEKSSASFFRFPGIYI